jgi:hypothetical protein
MDFIKNTLSNIKQRVSSAFSRNSEPTAQNIMSFEEGQGAPAQAGGKRRRKKQKSKKDKKSKSTSKKYKSRKHGNKR